MNATEPFLRGLEHYRSLLAEEEQEPDPERYRGTEAKAGVLKQLESFENDVLDTVPSAVLHLAEEECQQLKSAAADLALEAAALLIAADARDKASALLFRASGFAATELLKELYAARGELDCLRRLAHARWLFHKKKYAAARRCARHLAAQSTHPIFQQVAQAIVDQPEPITTAPTLYTLNGVGTGLYGQRDLRPDGSYIATLCFCILFIPLIPWSAYRVTPHEGGWVFFGKVPLSPFASIMKRIMLSVFLLGITSLAVVGYLNSTTYKSGQALAAAQALENGGKTDEAAKAYGRVVNDYAGSFEPGTVGEAALGFVRIRAAELPSPMTAEGAERADALVQRIESLRPVELERAAAKLVELLQHRAQELSSLNADSVGLKVRLHEIALRVAIGKQKERSETELTQARRSSAQLLTAEWPVQAFRIYLLLGTPDDTASAAQILQRIVAEPLLLRQERAAVQRFMLKAQAPHAQLVAQVTYALEAAERLEQDKARAESLALGHSSELDALLLKNPWDQEAALALAEAQIRQGKLDAGWKRLTEMPQPGLLIRQAQQTLARVSMERGELRRADEILSHYLAIRLPEFKTARQNYVARSKFAREQLLADAQAGRLPSDLRARIQAAEEAEKAHLFSDWLNQELDKDKDLRAAIDDYRNCADVVGASVTMGMLKLREAQRVSGPPHEALLRDSEQAFLSIGTEAEGSLDYHLGLGRVLHRLGKAKEGDEEFARILAGHSLNEHLSVARVYRELGLIKRAVDVATKVFDAGNLEQKDDAAILLALMATTNEEHEGWLRKASPTHSFVRRNLLKLEGEQLFRQGKLEQADAKYAQVVADYQSTIETDPSSANNAALVLLARFGCTGETQHLRDAVKNLELGLRQHADDALLVGNLASVLRIEAKARLLGRFLHLKKLVPSASDVEYLVGRMASGPFRAQVIEALSADVSFRRSLELEAQHEVLAPGSTTPVANQLHWFTLSRDTERLRALLARTQHVAAFDNAGEMKENAVTREAEERAKADYAAQKGKWKDTLARLRGDSHKPTESAAHLLLARTLSSLFELTPNGAIAEDSLAELRKVETAWNGLDVRDTVASMFVALAVLELGAEQSELLHSYAKLSRHHSLHTLLFVLERDHQAEYQRLKSNPRISEAASALKRASEEVVSDAAYGLGIMSGDEHLQAAGRRHLQSESVRLATELWSLIAPHDATVKTQAELLRAVGP